jgi:hypothetical protein
MRKGIVLQASGAAAATLLLGSVLSGTAYAATTLNNNPATHAPISVSYEKGVLVLINQLENGISQSTLESNFHSDQTAVQIPGGPMIPASGSQFTPGGPMIPASGSQSTPGGPMIPASGSQFTPGGPMIPASGSQFTPGGPMIPASTSNITDAAAYQQLVSAANLFTQMLRTDEMDGNSNTVSADISQSNRVLRALKSTFLTSTRRAKYNSSSPFTPAELSAVHCAAQFLEDMVTT